MSPRILASRQPLEELVGVGKPRRGENALPAWSSVRCLAARTSHGTSGEAIARREAGAQDGQIPSARRVPQARATIPARRSAAITCSAACSGEARAVSRWISGCSGGS